MAFDIALSGLATAQQELDVIAHNIANAATPGFKESRAEFADVFAATQTGLSNNAIGSGVDLKSVNQIFSQGDITFTKSNLDLAISGLGFFQIQNESGKAYTRAGSFGIDRDGFMVNSSGAKLQGFQANNGEVVGAVGDVRVDFADFSPRSSTKVTLAANIDASDTAVTIPFDRDNSQSYNSSTSTTVYDSLGTSHVFTLYYQKNTDNDWDIFAYVDDTQLTPAATDVTFDTDGTILTGGTAVWNPFPPGGGAANMTLELDQQDLTQYGADFGISKLTQDGFPTGRLSDVDIDSTGRIFARFTNGMSSILGQVALSNFPNPQGLQQLGNTSWGETFRSGSPVTGTPGSTNLGLIESGAIEEANVDLTAQLVEMITAQRNYQANAQTISTADAVTQTIINIR